MDFDDLTRLLDFAYNIEQRLLTQLDWWKDDLHWDDDATRRHAEGKVSELCDWLFSPAPTDTTEERESRIEASLVAGGMAVALARSIAKRVSKVTGRPPGAPRTTGRQAISALTLHLTTDKSYRDIASIMIGGTCEHTCPLCKDTIRPQAAQSGIRKRQPKARCSACKSTIRPNNSKQQVCFKCADALRQSIQRLKVFLEREGLLLDLPRRVELDRMSTSEMERLFGQR